MPAAVEKRISKVRRKGFSLKSAIRILKANHSIKQKGKHLAIDRPSAAKY